MESTEEWLGTGDVLGLQRSNADISTEGYEELHINVIP
jgi:hypothetical protein